MTLRERLAARYGREEVEREVLTVPASGHIDEQTVNAIHALAIRAHDGDVSARDCLFRSLQSRLDCTSNLMRPWPNTPEMVGIWDRRDVQQEAWVVFAELLAAWDQSVSFVPYLLARFAWRLRDRILRGIGKPQQQFGDIRIPEVLLQELLLTSEDEEPEAALMIQALLDELLVQYAEGSGSSEDVEAWLGLIGSSQESVLVSPAKSRRAKSASKKLRLA